MEETNGFEALALGTKNRKISPERCSICDICNECIYPGEFIAETVDGRLVHAGFHFSLKQGKDIMCETGGVGSGFWNGEGIDYIGESSAAIAMRTGKAVYRTIGPEGVKDELIDMPQTTVEEARNLMQRKNSKI